MQLKTQPKNDTNFIQKDRPKKSSTKYSQESFKNNSHKSKIISFQKIVYEFFQDNIVYGRPLKVTYKNFLLFSIVSNFDAGLTFLQVLNLK